jgi:transposase
LNKIFPKILKEAYKKGAKVYFEDESGISLNIFSGRTWSRKGQTPIVYRSGQRIKKTIASAVSCDGDLYFKTFEGGTTAEKYRTFLEDLNNLDDNIKYVIHDGLPSHKAKLVKEYVESTKGKLKLFLLPGYSPELNPDELVWDNLKKKLGKRAHKSLDDLESHAISVLKKMQSNPELISNFYRHIYV